VLPTLKNVASEYECKYIEELFAQAFKKIQDECAVHLHIYNTGVRTCGRGGKGMVDARALFKRAYE